MYSCDFEHYLVDTFSMMFVLGELDYDQINQIRIGLEMQAYALAVKYADNSEILQMQEYVDRLDQSHNEEENTFGIRRYITRLPEPPGIC